MLAVVSGLVEGLARRGQPIGLTIAFAIRKARSHGPEESRRWSCEDENQAKRTTQISHIAKQPDSEESHRQPFCTPGPVIRDELGHLQKHH